ncbi:DUF883 family protein [Limnoglobus roseus]|uniref:YtxH domain-containing protein n=1 Tax=Limnoglobus roseus TaxID=2598579 RepID=A0A5C1AGG4_9BACT|nr:hypothetical protein [Limnoglobus roseus]QEL16048.1 YtxH domain-containing protein [Limnoglobus roseus]
MNGPQPFNQPNRGTNPSPVPNNPTKTAEATNGGPREVVANALGQVAEKASQVGGQVAEKASHVADKVSHYASDAYGSVKDAGQKVEGWAEEAYGATSKQVGQYTDEVTTLIKNHPIPAILIGFGVGLLIGRAVR